MDYADFVHLHVHTQYSLLDGASRIKDLVKQAASNNMRALGITDHGNMFGALDFYQAAHSAGIKPIIGCEAYLATNSSRLEKTPLQQKDISHLVLFARNQTGYKNLMKLVSMGYLDGFYYYPRMDKEILAQYAQGLIGSSACLRGDVPSHLLQGHYNEALKAADDFSQIFGPGNFYLELMDQGIPKQKLVNEGLVKISRALDLPVIATNDVHYMNSFQAQAHDTLLCIQTQTTLNDVDRMSLGSDQFYFKSPQEMWELFKWIPEALHNTVEIAEKCEVTFDFNTFHLPRFDPPENLTNEGYLRKLCAQGVKRRYDGQMTKELEERLERELVVIENMGFVAYFLIVWDFINYAKNEGIPVGPGRGSAAGSVVSYLLGITDLDPLKYDLLFERFLNKDRAGMPDIDIDFCYERRGEVIDYVTRKYGQKNVAQIITFGTMQARAAIRDVGRALASPYSDVDKIAKLVPNELGITLAEAREKEPRLEDLCHDDPMARQIVETAQILEGLCRHASTHAAGVVISDKALDEYVPLFKTSDGQITTGFTMNGIAKIGLLKMDFLGLRTLTVISGALNLIKNIHQKDIDISVIPLDDAPTYAMLSKGQSFGVFQLESAGMRDLLKRIQPSVFEDLIAILALYRPGPMGSGMLDDFIKRKRGEVPIEYDHPKLEDVLKETYGIMVYQEQVMKTPVVLAGFSLVQADHLRRAMSKKIQSVMDQMRTDFVEGCQNVSQIPEDKANYLFDLIDYFSGYGFNKSHSAAYALITYQTAYLKANYPVEFMAALLNCEKNNTEKVVEYVKECAAMGLKVLPPHINHSLKAFDVVDNKTLQYGLLAVKNVGEGAIDSIVEQRQAKGGYTSLADLCERVDLRAANKKVFESLIKCGALDDFEGFRSQMMAGLEKAMDLGTKTQKEQATGQVSFFNMEEDLGGFNAQRQQLPTLAEWPKNQILSFEKEILGLYISGHPLEHYLTEIKEFTDKSTKKLAQAVDGSEVRLVGLINYVKLTNTRKNNERMAIIRVEDMEGEVDVVIFPSAFEQLSEYLIIGEVVFISGRLNFRDEQPTIIASDIKRIMDVYDSIKSIKIFLPEGPSLALDTLKGKLTKFPGKVPVYLNLKTKSNKSVEILVNEDLYVRPNENLMNEVKALVGHAGLVLNF